MALNKNRYLVAEPKNKDSIFDKGKSDTASLQKAFPNSPFGELGDSANNVITQIFLERVTGLNNFPKEYDVTLFPNGVDGNYGDAPNIDEVVTGGEGLPGSPYAPNIASPQPGTVDPKTIPASGAEATVAAKGAGSPWQDKDNTNKPDKASRVISSQTLTNIQLGKSAPLGGTSQ